MYRFGRRVTQGYNLIGQKVTKRPTSLLSSIVDLCFRIWVSISRMGATQTQPNSPLDPDASFSALNEGTGKRKTLTSFEENTNNEITEKVTVIPTYIDEKTERWLFSILKLHYLFEVLSDDQLMRIIKKMVKCSCQAEKYVFRQGERPGAFFIIEKGNVDIEGRGGYKKGNVTRDGSFGELGLLYNVNRSASIKARVDCEFWCLTKNNFKLVQKEIGKENYKNSIEYVQELQLFKYVSEEQKNSIAYAMYSLKYDKDTTVYKMNDEANSFYIIKAGEVVLRLRDKETRVKQHSYFGDECFEHLKKPLRVATAQALGRVECLSISREAIRNILGEHVKDLINYNILKSALCKTQFFSKLDPISLEKLIHLSKQKTVKNGQILFDGDRQPNKVVVILYGEGPTQKIGSVLGENFLLFDRKPSEYVRKQGDGEVAEISYERILKIFKETSIDMVRKRRVTIQEDSNDDESVNNMRQLQLRYNYESGLESLKVIKVVEESAFEKTILAENTQSRSQFSIRMIKKTKLHPHKHSTTISQLEAQQRILQEVQHPFLPRLIRKHKDKCFLYWLFEHRENYSLFDVIREIGLLSKTITKFYMAIILLALQYLHSKEIILRDLKPENVMVHSDGYLCISDLSSAKKLKKDIGSRTFTQIGTPHYMAPEVLIGKGYSYAADLWSAGVMFYELVVGSVPFGADEDDPFKIHTLVMKKKVLYPKEYQDEHGKEIIEQLLNKSPEQRLSKGFNNLKARAYFNSINWKSLLKKTETAPYKSKKFYYGQILPLEIRMEEFIQEELEEVPHSQKDFLADWDEEF